MIMLSEPSILYLQHRKSDIHTFRYSCWGHQYTLNTFLMNNLKSFDAIFNFYEFIDAALSDISF